MTNTTIEKYTEARRAQGFKSQEHLDAFNRYYHHSKCACCQGVTSSNHWNDGYQPAQALCAEGERLFKEYAKF